MGTSSRRPPSPTTRPPLQLPPQSPQQVQGLQGGHVLQVGVFDFAGDAGGGVGEELLLGGGLFGLAGEDTTPQDRPHTPRKSATNVTRDGITSVRALTEVIPQG